MNWYISAPLPIVAVCALLLVLTIAPKVMDDLVKANAVDTAVDLTKTLQKIRNYYAEHVLNDIDLDTGVEITHLHKLSKNSIPIPATFLIEMAQSYDEQDKLRVNISSPFPFETRKDRVLDEFQQYAWQQLTQDPNVPVSQFDTVNERRVVKVALPDRLTAQSCVDCHNSHQGSSKNDWQLGDVRGIVEITVDVETALERANFVSLMMILFSCAGLLILVLFNLHLAKKIVNPLRSITTAISALSERRFIDTNSKNNDYLEVAALSSAFVNFQGSERKRQALESEVHKLAYFDGLTQMPNRASTVKFLARELNNLAGKKSLKLLIVNIEKFNEVNDTLGYDIGDQALITVANRLHAVCKCHFVSRFNTTEFAISFVSDEVDDCQALAERILTIVVEPIYVEEHEISLCISIGCTQVSDNCLSVDELVSQANIALHQAVQHHAEKIVSYTSTLSQTLLDRVSMIKELKLAIENKELVPYFQPQFDLQTNELVGAEVLLRWLNPDGTLVPPFQFIPIAEKSRLIIPIGRLVLNEACRLNKLWQEQGLKPFRVAVNVSGVQFDEQNIVEEVQQALQSSGLDAKWLELEVTETALMSDIHEIVRKLTELRNLGLELAIDDFGTGYSSLNYLKQLPIHRLKIDQSFVRNVINNEDDQAIIETILNLGKTMKLKVLAEGVEGEAEERYLKSLNCDEVQGFYYAKPMSADKFREFLVALNAQ